MGKDGRRDPRDSGDPGRSFTGESLRELRFPLGGIGTGCVSLGGRGNLTDWEIFGRPGKGTELPATFFALWARPEGGPGIGRVLEREHLPPFGGPHGHPWWLTGGLPRFREVRFTGAYPLATLDFQDPAMPVGIRLEAFSPFVPLDVDATGLPVAVLRYRVHNTQPVAVDAALCGTLFNPIGYSGIGPLASLKFPAFRRFHVAFSGNHNRLLTSGGLDGLLVGSDGLPEQAPQRGTLCLSVAGGGTSFGCAAWPRERLLFDRVRAFWVSFSSNGTVPESAEGPSPDGESDVGSLGLRFRLAPGEERNVTFLLTWHFPARTYDWEGGVGTAHPSFASRLPNYYAQQHQDAWDIAQHCHRELPRMERSTRGFHAALFTSSLPPEVLDAASSNLATLKTNTFLRATDGTLLGFEGSGQQHGSCPLNCTHVFNYEQAVSHLFPSLARRMREVDFQLNTLDTGWMSHRTMLPLGSGVVERPATPDGQLGCILKLYREWRISGDTGWLAEQWPAAWRCLRFCRGQWDPDGDGLLEGEDQLVTYDCTWHGPNPLTAMLYLAALRAGSRIAEALGETPQAQELAGLEASGSRRLEERLWGGEYYRQRISRDGPKQVGRGCLSDQLLGQWFSWVIGLGDLVPVQRSRQALASVFRYNFRQDLRESVTWYRVYAMAGEAGLLNCTFPHGPAATGVPEHGFFSEVWSGVEYQVAASLIYAGLVDEGLQIVQAVRRRYDGVRRNPWNEAEAGDHYVRPLSSWSLLLALSGFQYCAADRSMGFAPAVDQLDASFFWSTGTGWGVFRWRQERVRTVLELAVTYGRLELDRLELFPRAGSQQQIQTIPQQVVVDGVPTTGEVAVGSDGDLKISFPQGLLSTAGTTMKLTLS